MERKGRLSPDKFGFSMPVDGPLYPRAPFYYRDAESIAVAFETDDDAAAAMLPQGLTIASPAVAVASVFTYHFSTLGLYHEGILSLLVQRGGEPAVYIAHILVDNDQAMAAGREIWGFPKKLAQISLTRRGEGVVGVVERPVGNRVCTVVVQPETPTPPDPDVPVLSLRVIPSQRPDGAFESAQLIETRTRQTVHAQFAGSGSVSFGAMSGIDPWSNLPIKKIVSAAWRQYDMILPLGTVVKEY